MSPDVRPLDSLTPCTSIAPIEQYRRGTRFRGGRYLRRQPAPATFRPVVLSELGHQSRPGMMCDRVGRPQPSRRRDGAQDTGAQRRHERDSFPMSGKPDPPQAGTRRTDQRVPSSGMNRQVRPIGRVSEVPQRSPAAGGPASPSGRSACSPTPTCWQRSSVSCCCQLFSSTPRRSRPFWASPPCLPAACLCRCRIRSSCGARTNCGVSW